MGIIYKATNLVNNKMYIGLTRNSINKRKSQHFYNKSNRPFHVAIREFGKENFIFEILEEVNEEEASLEEREVYWIDYFNSTDPEIGYNLTRQIWAGVKDMTQAERIRQYMSETHKKLWQDENFKRERLKRRENSFNSPEYRESQKLASIEMWKKEGHRETIQAKMKKIWEDEAYQKKISEKRSETWKKEEYREKMQYLYKSDDYVQNQRNHTKSRWEDPEWRKMVIEKQKEGRKSKPKRQLTEEQKKNLSEKRKLWWANHKSKQTDEKPT